ncbi:MAG: cell wall-active antibiotics response protein [Cyclobacteriaceae bacterium]|nr:cell wall-active antibiotics response protein [Cyclobacteriaceae bacterium]
MAEDNDSKRLWLGIIFLILGGLWLLNNLNIPYFEDLIPHYLISWRSFLIIIGAFLFFGRDKKAIGLMLMLIGGFLLLDDIFWLDIRFWEVFWPSVLLFLGGALVLKRGPSATVVKGDPDYIDDMAVFGGGEKKITSQNFRGGKVTAIFGGSKINLSQAGIEGGTTPLIDIFTMFGGTDVIVPEDWTVKVETSAIFGGFSDKRKSVVNVVNNPDKTLVIKGLIIFGGGEVKS